MTLPRYPAYKDSGVEWLGEVPVHWEVCSLRHVLSDIFNGLTATQVDESEGTVPVTRIESISKGVIDFDRLGYIAAEDARDDRKLLPGDLLFSNINSLNMIGNCAEYTAGKQIFAGMNLLVLRPIKSIFEHWLFYLIRSVLFRQEVESRAKPAINQASISQSSLLGISVPLPSLAEQEGAATFLDHETSKIDALIAEQQNLIALLKEKRQAVISHAVTKGLNPDAPMKDSGVEWLGEVPENWRISRLGHISDILAGYPFSSTLFGPDGVPVIRMSDFSGGRVTLEEARKVLAENVPEIALAKKGDILLGLSGSISNFAVVEEHDLPIAINQRVAMVRTAEPAWTLVYWFLQSSAFLDQIAANLPATTIMNIGMGDLHQCRVPIPPSTDQIDIASFLDRETTKIDTLIAEATHGILFLQERRSALISAAVTGKIDVRGLVPQEAA